LFASSWLMGYMTTAKNMSPIIHQLSLGFSLTSRRLLLSSLATFFALAGFFSAAAPPARLAAGLRFLKELPRRPMLGEGCVEGRW
jgi:hypothetical protein